MILRKNLIEVSYPIYSLNDDKYLIGINSKFQIRGFRTDELIDEFEFDECNFCVLNGGIYFNVGSSLIKYEINTGATSLFYKSKSNNEIWFLNESYLFNAKRTKLRREFQYSLFSTKEKQIKWTEKSNNRLSSLSNEALFFTDILGSFFKRKSIENGTEIWSINFLGNRISGNLFLFKNIIIIPILNQDLLGIDIDTGEELWRLHNCNHYHQKHPNTGNLIGLSSNSFGDNFYQIIDPISGEKVIDKKFENFYYETTPNLACISESHYYFISNLLGDGTGTKSERVSHLGCINLITHELEWIEKIDGSAYQKPEVQNNKFYLIDGDKILKIFEKP